MKTPGFHSIVAGLFLLTLSTIHSQNIIADGDFSSTTEIRSYLEAPPPANTWLTFVNTFEKYTVKAKASVVKQEFHFKIREAGYNVPDIQLIQTGFALEAGRSYKLSFDVKADADRTFGLFLGENGGNWVSHIGYDNYTQNATAEWRNISIEFDVFTVFPEHKLSFELGKNNANVYLDNVTLTDLGPIEKMEITEMISVHQDIEHPAFRPESTLDQAFLDSYKEATIIMYPTITRTTDTTTWSRSLSKGLAQNLRSLENVDISLNETMLDPGELKGEAQFQFFQNDMARLANEIKENEEEADYYMIPEILFGPEGEGTLFVFGIHLFILDKEGENAFSFLLNSHHELFIKAKLYAYNPDEDDVAALKQRSLEVAAQAFSLMVDQSELTN